MLPSFWPGTEQFTNATTRWQEYKEPNITVAVKVATESDVPEIVIETSAFHLYFAN